MRKPKHYSRIAIAVSTALTSMVFSTHAAWIDIDSLPASGMVSSLSPELQALFPAQTNDSFKKTAKRRIMFISGVPVPFPFMVMD